MVYSISKEGGSIKSRNALSIGFLFVIAFLGCSQKNSGWKLGTPLSKETIKVAIIHPNEIDKNSLYDYAHYLGTVEMQRNIGLDDSQIIRRFNVLDNEPAVAEGIIRDCIAEGANIIIAPSWGYMDVCARLAREFPSVVFAHATGYRFNDVNFVNYSVKLYQARYLSGIVAGLSTQSGLIGYVAAMGTDNSEVTGGINAFAIGVEEVNPEARVLVHITYNWYDPMGETDATNELIASGCDIIASHCNTASPQIAARKAGVRSIGFNSDMSVDAPNSVITSVIPRWGVFYTRLVESIINGTFRPESYFLGLEDGVVDITPLNEKLAPPGVQEAVDAARQRILNGYNVFDGELFTNTGAIIGTAGETLPNHIILGSVNWYYRNVILIK